MTISEINNILVPGDCIGGGLDTVDDFGYDTEFYKKVQDLIPELFEFPTLDE